MRRPGLLVACHLTGSAFITLQCLRMLFNETMPSMVDVLLGASLINRTRDQLAIIEAHQAVADHAKVQRILRSIRISTWLLTTEFAALCMVGNAVVLVVLVSAATGPDMFGRAWIPTVYEVNAGLVPSNGAVKAVVLAYDFVMIMALLVLSRRLRIVQDAFGTKVMLRRAGLGTMLGVLIYLVGLATLSKVSDLGLRPLYQSRRQEQIRAGLSKLTTGREAAALTEFELFLMTADGFAAFQAHLRKEFSVENLLFWKAVCEFRAHCDDGRLTPTAIKAAWDIFDQYLSKEAPLEVNLPSASLKEFRDQVFHRRGAADADAALSAEVFDDAAAQLVRLMEVNSLQRFIKSGAPSWDKFVAMRREQNEVGRVGELLNRSRQSRTSNAGMAGVDPTSTSTPASGRFANPFSISTQV